MEMLLAVPACSSPSADRSSQSTLITAASQTSKTHHTVTAGYVVQDAATVAASLYSWPQDCTQVLGAQTSTPFRPGASCQHATGRMLVEKLHHSQRYGY